MTLLVCISTNQEVTNLIPALEYESRAVLAFATPHALSQQWPQRLADALRTRAVHTIPIPNDHEYAPARLATLILKHIAQHRADERVCFAWAGGQKPQSVGMWLAFESLSTREPDGGHIAAYMEQNQGKLLEWRRPADDANPIPITRSLSLDELLGCYGQIIRQEEHGAGISLWPAPSPAPWVQETYKLYQGNVDFRRLCFEYHQGINKNSDVSIPSNKEINTYLEQVNNRAIAHKSSPKQFKLSPHEQSNATQEFPFLFELLVQHRTIAWLALRAAHISEARANVSFASLKPNEPTGELDVAIVTRAGRLIALDAKINAKGSGTTRRAQESSVRQSGGDFAKRAIVIPAHSDDINQAPQWFSSENVGLIQRWQQDPRSVPPLIPFDDGDAFERALDKLCEIK
jgi:hypothetical protein